MDDFKMLIVQEVEKETGVPYEIMYEKDMIKPCGVLTTLLMQEGNMTCQAVSEFLNIPSYRCYKSKNSVARDIRIDKIKDIVRGYWVKQGN